MALLPSQGFDRIQLTCLIRRKGAKHDSNKQREDGNN